MNSNLFWCIVGIIGGAVVSLIISLIFHLIGKTRKHISYTVKTSCLISNEISNINFLEVKYNDKKIDNLYVSKIVIKNIGNSIIEKNDFSTSNPLSINALKLVICNDDFKDKTYMSKKNNVDWSFKLPSENSFSQLLIDFDYIPKKGVINFNILHTNQIYIKGKLKDGTITKDNIFSLKNIFLFIIIDLIAFFSGYICGLFFI